MCGSANANGVANIFIDIQMLLTWRLGIKPAEEVDVPGAFDLPGEWFAVVVFAHIGEVVGVIAEYVADGEWPFPWGDSLCMPFCPGLTEGLGRLPARSDCGRGGCGSAGGFADIWPFRRVRGLVPHRGDQLHLVGRARFLPRRN
jgi:hypothetical protein